MMKKCTYGVEWIAGTRITSDKSGAPIAEGVV